MRRSTKLQGTPLSGIREPADRAWRVKLARAAQRVVTRFGYDDPDFSPSLKDVLEALEHDPKQFEKKAGKLAGIRAAPLRYRNAPWRIPFILDEREHAVLVLTIDKHDAAYRAASR